MSFEKQVLERSKSTPVVVDFWAPWCGPCRFLGPVIEELAAATQDWELVKINTDEQPELMQQYQIQGIPAVKMFINGQVTAEFTGALPKHQIEKWLEEHLPDETRERFGKIVLGLEKGDSKALEDLKTFVEENPANMEAAVLLSEKLVFEEPTKAVALICEIKLGNPLYDRAQHILIVDQLMNVDCPDDSEAGRSFAKGISHLKEQAIESAIQALIDSVSKDKLYCDELARKALIAIFSILGQNNDLTKKHRRKFDMVLY